VTINNACVKCSWFSGHIRDWPAWNGELDDDLDVSSVDPSTVSADNAAATGGGGGETELQAQAARIRSELANQRRRLAEASDALAMLNGGPVRRAEGAPGVGIVAGLAEQRRLTPDLQRMVDQEMMTRDQAMEMMPPPPPVVVVEEEEEKVRNVRLFWMIFFLFICDNTNN
jgi:hypothetical protein